MAPNVQLSLPSGVALSQELIVVGLVDACGAGTRVAQALEAGPAGRVETVAVETVGLDDCSPVFHAPSATSDPSGASSSPRVVLTNIFPAGSTAPVVSSLSINCAVPEAQYAHLAASLAALVSAARPKVVLVAAAAVMPGAIKSAGAHVLPLNGAPVPPALASAPAVPAGMALQDPQLAVAVHSLEVTGARAVLCLVPAHKLGVMSSLSEADPPVLALCDAVAAAVGPVAAVNGGRAVAGGCALHHVWYKAGVSGGTGGERMYT